MKDTRMSFVLLAAILVLSIAAAGRLSAQPTATAESTSAETAAVASAENAAPIAPQVVAEQKTFMQVAKQGGIMMIPLVATSVLLLTLVIDGFIRLRNERLAPARTVEELRAQYRAGQYDAAFQTCKVNPCLLTTVLRAGLSMLGTGRANTEQAMAETLAKEITQRMTRIRYMSVIGVVTPMMGLTGTVLGMIHAFSTIGHSGIGDPSALAAAIGEVLVATFTGLAVGIPAFAFYYYFSNRMTGAAAYVEDIINSLFRGMPYLQFDGIQIGDDPIYAAPPNPSMLPKRSPRSARSNYARAARPVQASRVPRAEKDVPGTVPCPNCQTAVDIGAPLCPGCATALNWSA